MERRQAKIIMEYYSGISDMIYLLQVERSNLENLYYNALGAAAADGMPHSGEPGKPAERMAINAADHGAADRLREIAKRLAILAEDTTKIRQCIDAVCGKYNQILSMRYLHRDSWGRIAAYMAAPDSTVRLWHDKALVALGAALNDEPKINEILSRALRARV